jgi:hypothetical protein
MLGERVSEAQLLGPRAKTDDFQKLASGFIFSRTWSHTDPQIECSRLSLVMTTLQGSLREDE